MASRTEFVNDVYERAIKLGIPEPQARLAASQAALESNYGKSAPGNNYFGIKGKGQTLKTKEVVDGQTISTDASFRKYDDLDASLNDWWDLVQRRWPEAASAETFEEAAAGLNAGGRGGYATDPNYVAKLAAANGQLRIPPGSIPETSAQQQLQAMFGPQGEMTALGYAPLSPPAPLVPGQQADPRMMNRNPSGPISGQAAMAIQGRAPITGGRIPANFNPDTLQTLSPPPLNRSPSSPVPSNNGGMIERSPSRASSSSPVPIPTNNGGMIERAPTLSSTQTIANPAYAQWQKDMAAYEAAANNSGYIPYSGYGDPRGAALTQPPPAPPRTITVPVTPPSNPIGQAFTWIGEQAGALGNSAMGTINGVGAALPGAIDTAKENLVKGIMMSPEARSPFVNGAIGAIGQTGRQYLGNGMTSALRYNHDTGEFERYNRRIAVPTNRRPFEDYNNRAIGGSQFSRSISSMGGHTPSNPNRPPKPSLLSTSPRG